MLKNACTMCKVVGLIAIIGALNWGMVAIFHVNMVEQIAGMGMAAAPAIAAAPERNWRRLNGMMMDAPFWLPAPHPGRRMTSESRRPTISRRGLTRNWFLSRD